MGYRETYGQYCPIAKAAEIFADRWTPLIIREIMTGMHRFNELDRGLPGVSRSLLVQRLRRLEHAGVVERRKGVKDHLEYYLTPAGEELVEALEVLGNWGARWAFADPQPDELDPVLLLWWVRRRINRDLLPPQRVVVEFDFRGAPRVKSPTLWSTRQWLLLEPGDVSICLTHPGFDTDVLVAADLSAFYRVWFGRMSLSDAVDQGLVQLSGRSDLVRAFPSWLKYSHFAGAIRAAMEARAPQPALSPSTVPQTASTAG